MLSGIIAYRLKKLRSQKKITQVELAKLLNVGQSTINHWESGRQEPQWDTLIKLASFFNVSLLYFYAQDDKTQKAFHECIDEIIRNLLESDSEQRIAEYNTAVKRNKELIARYEALPKTADWKEKGLLLMEIMQSANDIKKILFGYDFERLANIDAELYSDPKAEITDNIRRGYYSDKFMPKRKD